MKIELNNVTNLGNVVIIHMDVSTKDDHERFEKLFGLTEENGRHLVIRGYKEKSEDGSYPYRAFIEGDIYDHDEKVAELYNKMFKDDDCTEIQDWIDEHEEEWRSKINVNTENGIKKHYVTFKIEARYIAEVDADTLEEAKEKANLKFADADFGSATDIEGEAIFVEDENGNYLWEK